MPKHRYLFTSESVTKGHPDKIADQISDGILDEILRRDPTARVACETLVTTGLALVAGEVRTEARVDYSCVVRQIIDEIGYTSPEYGFSGKHCAVLIALNRQSPDIARGVDEDPSRGKKLGAGDQGLMFGFACNETREYMPLPIALAHRIVNLLAELRESGEVPWLRPDGKTQVTVEYEGFTPRAVRTIVVSTQHDPDVSNEEIQETVKQMVKERVLGEEWWNDEITWHINPTGRFVLGGPHADTGVTGRKIIVDTYGGSARHGGGAFSGKDPTKVDRSASYMARYIAKNIVAAGLAQRCEVQLAYVIGVSDPVSVSVNTFETHVDGVPDEKIAALIPDIFPLQPGAIIEHLRLLRPIYRQTAAGGHFGRDPEKYPDFTWEKLDKVDELRRAAGLA